MVWALNHVIYQSSSKYVDQPIGLSCTYFVKYALLWTQIMFEKLSLFLIPQY